MTSIPKHIGNIELENVSKKFGEVIALKDVSISIEAGTILGIIGPNGAGKSTLCRIIAGVMKPTSYSNIKIAGFDLGRNNREIKQYTGILPESAGLYEKLTVTEYLQLIGGLYNISRKDVHEKIDQFTERLELLGLEDRLIETLSKGQKQKVAFIASIINDPIVLLLDEPTIALDPKAQRILAEILLEYQNDDRVIIITSHLLQTLEKYCTSFAVVEEGIFTFQGTAKELMSSVGAKDIEEAYLRHVDNDTNKLGMDG